MNKANSEAVLWNRKNPTDAICVYTAEMVLAGRTIGIEKCGIEANTLMAGGFAACTSHMVAVREVMRAALNGKAVR